MQRLRNAFAHSAWTSVKRTRSLQGRHVHSEMGFKVIGLDVVSLT